MAGTLKRIAGPAYIATSATNIYTPAASTIYTVIKHIHIANKTNSAATFALYVGLTGGSAGGTELFGGNANHSVAANAEFDAVFNPGLRMADTDFLSGIAGTASALVITVMGEQHVV